mgnify:FL=1
MLFRQLVDGSKKQRANSEVSETFFPKLKSGYLITIPSFINEDIPTSEIEAWGQDYQRALKDLIFMGAWTFDGLYNFSLVPRETREQKVDRLREIERILST